jgi:DNA-binding transcriptional LysR family regulator
MPYARAILSEPRDRRPELTIELRGLDFVQQSRALTDGEVDAVPVPWCGVAVSDVEALLLAVARGDAIAFLPAAAAWLYPRPGVSYVLVADAVPTTAALAWRATSHNRSAIVALRAAARAVVSST